MELFAGIPNGACHANRWFEGLSVENKPKSWPSCKMMIQSLGEMKSKSPTYYNLHQTGTKKRYTRMVEKTILGKSYKLSRITNKWHQMAIKISFYQKLCYRQPLTGAMRAQLRHGVLGHLILWVPPSACEQTMDGRSNMGRCQVRALPGREITR